MIHTVKVTKVRDGYHVQAQGKVAGEAPLFAWQHADSKEDVGTATLTALNTLNSALAAQADKRSEKFRQEVS